jgi:DNA mismatch endonuclease (patch repair protein)
MRSNARPTKPEAAARSALHRRGFRFRKSYRIRVGDRWTRPDVVFTRARVAVYVDGCFWHGCPEHGNTPRANTEYWVPKLNGNVERDQETDRRLRQLGWTVIRAWEHEAPERIADRVARAVEAREAPSV